MSSTWKRMGYRNLREDLTFQWFGRLYAIPPGSMPDYHGQGVPIKKVFIKESMWGDVIAYDPLLDKQICCAKPK